MPEQSAVYVWPYGPEPMPPGLTCYVVDVYMRVGKGTRVVTYSCYTRCKGFHKEQKTEPCEKVELEYEESIYSWPDWDAATYGCWGLFFHWHRDL